MKSLIIAALAAVCVAFAGCATTATPIALPSPQQLAAQLCPVVNADLTALSTSTLLNSTQQAALINTIIPANMAVCAAGATLDVASLTTFNNTAFPALIDLVKGLPTLKDQPTILLALQLAQPLVTQVVNAAVAAATVPASSVPVASAPVAASA